MMIVHGGGWGAWRMGREPTPTRIDWHILPRILGYFRPYWRLWSVVLALLAVSNVLGLVPPLLMRSAVDQAIPSGNLELLVLLAVGMVAFPLFGELLGVARNYLVNRIGQGIMFDLRNQLYAHLQSMSLRFFTSTKTGDMMSRLNNDVSGVQGVVSDMVIEVVGSLVMLVSTLVLVFAMDWRLALLSLVTIPLYILPMRRVGRIRHRLSKETSEKQGELSALMQETLSISGALLMKAFTRERWERSRFQEKNRELMDLQLRQSLVGRWFFMFLRVFGALGPALIFGVGGWLVIRGELTLGTIIAFTSLIGRLYGPASTLANVHVDLMRSFALFERLFEYLDMHPEIADRPGAVALPAVRGAIRFEQVSFEYVQGRHALQDVSFEVQPGQLVALVGPSGAGKTTVTYLVPRFYDVTAGSIQVDGHDVREVTVESLRRHVGMVTQESFLFHATVRENLLYANPEASQAQVEAACRAAYIHDFIVGLPEGYETVVGERGYRLSGGEKQRLAIARVILKDPAILLLDEATSSLDSRSEALIQAALTPLMEGRTSLVIAHRLSTILAADLILVFDRGHLVERGSHAELLEHGGLYARLYHQQFRTGVASVDSGVAPGEWRVTSRRGS
jgi:ATP-binding cassette subfamily B protein